MISKVIAGWWFLGVRLSGWRTLSRAAVYALHRHDAVTRDFVGSITRWSRDCAWPPPPRPLVRRAPRAGVQAPDQRFLVPGLVGVAGFSGGFLGALSTLRGACHGRVARRVRRLSSGFAIEASSPAHLHKACPVLPDAEATADRLVGAGRWRPVLRDGYADSASGGMPLPVTLAFPCARPANRLGLQLTSLPRSAG